MCTNRDVSLPSILDVSLCRSYKGRKFTPAQEETIEKGDHVKYKSSPFLLTLHFTMYSLIYSLVFANYMQIKYILCILNSSIFKAEFVC